MKEFEQELGRNYKEFLLALREFYGTWKMNN